MSDGPVVEVSVDVAAPPEVVFLFLCEPARMTEWLGAAVEMGGEESPFRVRFDRFGTIVEGRVVELTPPRRAVFTWGVASGPQAEAMPPGSTRVTIDLEPVASGTRVTLRHEGIPDEPGRREHEMGWRHYAGQLAQAASMMQRGPLVQRSIDAWLSAWSEADGAARRALVETCFPDDGRFEDEHVSVFGAAELDAHLARVQAMLPGFRLGARGGARIVRDAVLFGWEVAGPGGAIVMQGENFADLAADGRLRRVVGFPSAPPAAD